MSYTDPDVLGPRLRWLKAATLVLLLMSTACGRADRSSPPTEGTAISVTDASGRAIALHHPAQRVVSLVPAATETLFALGVGDIVVGRTRYDSEPHLSHIPSVGGGLDPSLEAIVALSPDLVLAFETTGGSRLRGRLEQLGIPVFTVEARDTADILANIDRLGRLAGRDSAAARLSDEIRADLTAVSRDAVSHSRPRVIHVGSIDPPIIAGPRTYVAELLAVAGADPVDIGAGNGTDWPQVSLEALVAAAPDAVILAVGSDPAATVERLRAAAGWRELAAVREGRIAVVNVDLVSRPGPRLPEIARELRRAMSAVGALP